MGIDVAVALAIAERRPQDVAKIAGQLKQITAKARGDRFLIVSVGDVFVQFLALEGPDALVIEAISNAYLPAGKQLGQAETDALQGLGFELPLEENFNFSMDYAVKSDADLDLAAVIALAALEIYRCPEDAPLSFELNL
jgi:hypothetical protein